MRLSHDTARGWVLRLSRRAFARFQNDWRQCGLYRRNPALARRYSLTLGEVAGEVDAMSRMLELRVVLLGLGFYVRYDVDYAHSRTHTLAEEASHTTPHELLGDL